MKQTLTNKQLVRELKTLPDWTANINETSISKNFIFASHIDALVFIARVTVHAEVMQHHPDIEFKYKKVKIKLSTHDIKGISKLDIQLAERIERSTTGG